MSKGYWVALLTVTDRHPYEAYVAANAAVFARYGGRFIIRGGQFHAVHGDVGARQVVIEFDSYEAALDCYHSAEYQAIYPLLLAGGDVRLVIVEGT